MGALLLPVGGVSLVGLLGGFAHFHAKVIFGEVGHHGDGFIIYQGGGFVERFAVFGAVIETL